MSIQEIRLFGDPVLLTPASPVVDFDKELRKLVADLTDTMLEAPGAGLAAPQIGVPDADDDRLLLPACHGFVDTPFLSAICIAGLEQVLPVMHVDHGIAFAGPVIIGRQQYADIAGLDE